MGPVARQYRGVVEDAGPCSQRLDRRALRFPGLRPERHQERRRRQICSASSSVPRTAPVRRRRVQATARTIMNGSIHPRPTDAGGGCQGSWVPKSFGAVVMPESVFKGPPYGPGVNAQTTAVCEWGQPIDFPHNWIAAKQLDNRIQRAGQLLSAQNQMSITSSRTSFGRTSCGSSITHSRGKYSISNGGIVEFVPVKVIWT